MSQILVWCEHDALYAAIELKLGSLPGVSVVRLNPGLEPGPEPVPWASSALVILASLVPSTDALSLLAHTPWLGQVGDTPVLVISEVPSRPESEDKVTFLNFPFDLDELTTTVQGIIGRQPQVDGRSPVPES